MHHEGDPHGGKDEDDCFFGGLSDNYHVSTLDGFGSRDGAVPT
jgi:hypothetical protein